MSNNLIIGIVISLVVGAFGGFYYGKNIGITEGKQEVLNQQAIEEQAKLKEVQEAANPFAGVEETSNPFKDVYKNPFE